MARVVRHFLACKAAHAGSIPTPFSFFDAQLLARMAKLVDAADLKSAGRKRPCRFDSGSGHQ